MPVLSHPRTRGGRLFLSQVVTQEAINEFKKTAKVNLAGWVHSCPKNNLNIFPTGYPWRLR